MFSAMVKGWRGNIYLIHTWRRSPVWLPTLGMSSCPLIPIMLWQPELKLTWFGKYPQDKKATLQLHLPLWIPIFIWFWVSVFSSVQLCPTLCNLMDCRTPGFPVHHQLPEHAQTHVHQVGDAIQPSHPLLSIFPSIRVFSNESVLHIRWPKYQRFSFSFSPSNEYSGLISLRINWFDFLAV